MPPSHPIPSHPALSFQDAAFVAAMECDDYLAAMECDDYLDAEEMLNMLQSDAELAEAAQRFGAVADVAEFDQQQHRVEASRSAAASLRNVRLRGEADVSPMQLLSEFEQHICPAPPRPAQPNPAAFSSICTGLASSAGGSSSAAVAAPTASSTAAAIEMEAAEVVAAIAEVADFIQDQESSLAVGDPALFITSLDADSGIHSGQKRSQASYA